MSWKDKYDPEASASWQNGGPLVPSIRYKIRVQAGIIYRNSRNVTRRFYVYDLAKGILA